MCGRDQDWHLGIPGGTCPEQSLNFFKCLLCSLWGGRNQNVSLIFLYSLMSNTKLLYMIIYLFEAQVTFGSNWRRLYGQVIILVRDIIQLRCYSTSKKHFLSVLIHYRNVRCMKDCEKCMEIFSGDFDLLKARVCIWIIPEGAKNKIDSTFYWCAVQYKGKNIIIIKKSCIQYMFTMVI